MSKKELLLESAANLLSQENRACIETADFIDCAIIVAAASMVLNGNEELSNRVSELLKNDNRYK